MPQQRVEVEEDAVFLNIPYDPQFEKLYFAYIVGLTTLAFVPRATLGLTGAARLERLASWLWWFLSNVSLPNGTLHAPQRTDGQLAL
jgi:hypothetical protein